MAAVDLLTPAFGIKWAQDGTVAVIDEAQWRAGWAFIGATPPTVEQFNKVMQIADEKSNYLYAQMLSVFTAAGEVPSVADNNSMRDALASLYNGGRIINVRAFTSSGTFTRSPGATSGIIDILGGGAGGAGSTPTSASQASVAPGGGSGAYGRHVFAGNMPASQAYTIGAGGTGGGPGAVGGAGGATTFGALTAPGAPAPAAAGTGPIPIMIGGGLGAPVATGCNVFNGAGQSGNPAFALALNALVGGNGGGTPFGSGANPLISASANGPASVSRGGGGAGATNGASAGAGFSGGNGGAGLIIVMEWS